MQRRLVECKTDVTPVGNPSNSALASTLAVISRVLL
jgi:hypothetical protein